jgi:predicted glutamine amidotransferase
MCRWAAYSGDPVFLEELILSPAHSLIEQSHRAQQAKTPINGDGFGVAWYGEREEPGLYRDILPAWADRNLRSLAGQIRSGLFLAHVRASTMGETSRVNCHPFVWRNWTFMHNGQIGEFAILRRSLEVALDDRLYNERAGTTDSEILFLLALQFGLATDPHAAFVKTIRFVIETARKKGLSPSIRFTSAFSCGSRLYAIRYATDAHAPTLFWAHGSKGGNICLVSEPFEDSQREWQSIPESSFVTVENGCCTVMPFDVTGIAVAA